MPITINPEPTPVSPVLAVREMDPATGALTAAAQAKRDLLQQTIADHGVAIQQADGTIVGDVFATAVAVRANLPAGLEAGDFDGDDIAPILAELLSV